MKIFLDSSPLNSGHSHRGIGTYTRELLHELDASKDVDLTENSKQAELIHYPHFDLFQPTLPSIFNKPTVVTVHDVIPLEFPEQYPPGKRGKLSFWYQQMRLKHAAAVITDSQYSKQTITKYLKYPAKNIFVTHLAAKKSFARADATIIKQVKKKYDINGQYILYVGDINYNKNIPQLIKSLKFLPSEIKLVLVGKNFRPQPIPEWQWIESQMALSDVKNRVLFLPNIDTDEELGAIYSDALCYVQPSLSEGFGLPVLEAMRCECPVVITHLGSLPEIGGGHALIAEPEAESLAGQVELSMSRSAKEKNNLLKEALAWAQTFTWKKTASTTIAVYKKILQDI